MFLFFEKFERINCSKIDGLWCECSSNDSFSSYRYVNSSCSTFIHFLCVAEFHEGNNSANILVMKFLSAIAELEVAKVNGVDPTSIFGVMQMLNGSKLRLKLQIYDCQSIAALITDEYCEEHSIKEKQDNFLSTLLKNVKNSMQIQTHIGSESSCKIISLLAISDFRQINKSSSLIVPDILGFMQVFSKIEMVQLASLAALIRLTKECSVVPDNEMMELIFTTALNFMHHSQLITLILDIFNETFESAMISELNQVISKWLFLINSIMCEFNFSQIIQIQACSAVSLILTTRPDVVNYIGTNLCNDEVPIHNAVVFTVMLYKHSYETLHVAITAIYCLSIYSKMIKDLLKESGVFLSIMSGIKDHVEELGASNSGRYSVLLKTGLKSFKFLCEKYDDMIPHMHDCLVLHHLASIVRTKEIYIDIHEEIFCFFSLIMGVRLLCDGAIKYEMHIYIISISIKNLSHFIKYQKIINYSLDTLAQFANNGYFTKLVEGKCIQLILLLLNALRSNIQVDLLKKVFYLITFISDVNIVHFSGGLLEELCQLIIVYGKLLYENEEILTGILACIRKLCEESSKAALEFVNEGINSLIFHILMYSDQSSTRLVYCILELASEILYTLGCVQDLKNQMLIMTIKDKILEGTILLIELGADVNYGYEYDTPLCIAVFNNCKEITQHLLRKGASDVHNAFKYACDQNLDDIVSILVFHTSQIQESYGEVNMNDMNLHFIKAQWFNRVLSMPSTVLPRFSGHADIKRSFSYVSSHFQLRKKRGDMLLVSSECEGSLDISEKKISNSHSLDGSSFKNYPSNSENLGFMANLEYYHPDIVKKSKYTKEISKTPIQDTMFNSLLLSNNYVNEKDGFCISSFGPYEFKKRYSKAVFDSSISAHCLDNIFSRSSAHFMKYSKQRKNEHVQKSKFSNYRTNTFELDETSRFTTGIPVRPISPTSLLVSNKVCKSYSEVINSASSVYDSAFESFGLSINKEYDTSDSEESTNEYYVTSEELWGLQQKKQPMEMKHSLAQVMESLDESDENFFNRDNQISYEKIHKQRVDNRCSTRHTFHKLILSNNRLSRFSFSDLRLHKSDFYHKLSGLHTLDLHGNLLSSIESEIFIRLTCLTELNLSNNIFVHFPYETLLSPSLQNLNLMDNQITSIPNFNQYFNLKILNISSNKLQLFPDYLGKQFPYLETLVISRNFIQHLPEIYLGFLFLNYLDVSENKLSTVHPKFLLKCSSLETLIASNNKIIQLPDDISENIRMLEVVRMSENRFSIEIEQGRIPIFFTNLPKLKILELKSCGLIDCPSPRRWVSRLLKDLILSYNNISTFSLFGDCNHFWPHIERINLSNNKLKTIPKEIGFLNNLKLLDISCNPSIVRIPIEVGKLSNLFALNLSGLNNLDVTLRGMKTREILKYFQARINNSVARNRAQIFFLGPYTEIRRKLLVKFDSNLCYENYSHLNIVIREWKCKTDLGETMKIQLWDFVNNLCYLPAYQAFFTERTLYLIPYKLSDGIYIASKLQPWILAIHSVAPRATCILIGVCDKFDACIIDDAGSVFLSLKEMIDFRGYIDYVKSINVCLHSEGLQTRFSVGDEILRQLEATSIRGDKLMGNFIPENYAAFENIIFKERMALAESEFPVLTHDQVLTFLYNSSLKNKLAKDDVDQSMLFMHQCNTVFIYSSVFTIPDKLYVFNPNWIMRLINVISDLPYPNPYLNKHAILHDICFEHLFRPPTFPYIYLHVYRKLLEIVNFIIPTKGNEFFIPSRLPSIRPVKKIPLICLASLITRRVRMTYTPITFWGHFLSRMIVQTNFLDLLPQIEIWQRGIYFLWNQDTFLIVETLAAQENCFDIIVSKNKQGHLLLGESVDLLDMLIDEKYPELKEVSILTGSQRIHFSIPCPLCIADNNEYSIQECLEVWKETKFIICPQTDKHILLDHLIPDLIFLDLDVKFHIRSSEIDIDIENPAALLGKGGFGEVYKAKYHSSTIALKLFSNGGTISDGTLPYQMLRREISVLKRLNHPNVIGFVGVSLDMDVKLLIEYAKYGSLAKFQRENLTPLVKHSISMQILSTLSYIHSKSIIYRDLKADNVMVFCLSQKSIHVKLIDYGTACVVTKAGLYADIGTAGYKSPEMLRVRYSNEPYAQSTDIYSFGMLAYNLFTNGHNPFEDLLHVNEIDRAIEEGKPIEDLLHFGYNSWPDLQDLIDNCLQYYPNFRPTARQLYDRFYNADFLGLKRNVAICLFSSKEILTTRYFVNDLGEDANELWIVSSIDNQSQLAVLNLSNIDSKLQGKYLGHDVTILSITSVGSHSVLMGSFDGIRVYDGYTQLYKYSLQFLHHPVICFASSIADTKRLYAGTTGGVIAHISSYALKNDKEDYIVKFTTISPHPIKQIKVARQRLWVCSNGTIYVIKPLDFSIERTWKISSESMIGGFAIVNSSLWTFEIESPKIEIWDINKPVKRGTIDISSLPSPVINLCAVRNSTTDIITSIFYNKQDSIWIGTRNGVILFFDLSSHQLIFRTQRYASNVSNIIASPFARYSVGNNRYIVTTGKGFLSKFSTTKHDFDSEYSYLLIWNPQIVRIQREIVYSSKHFKNI